MSFEQIIHESPIMQKIFKEVQRIAKSTASVFISGESGTGKEVIAHVIHRESQRASQRFVRVNCAAIPSSLLESEFFGHEKGSFTGAIQKRIGRFELAHRGTLLLDEVTEISLELQPKLLRAVQEMEFERVGGTQAITVDVRLIATSNRDMQEALEKKLFREDLYYRLNVIPIHLPPLRERKEDILPLSEHFLQRACTASGQPNKMLTADAKEKLLDYHWPGNIRELANIMERIAVMQASDVIDSAAIPIDVKCLQTASLTLREMQRKWISDALKKTQNNRTRAAKLLGISVRTLRNKLKN